MKPILLAAAAALLLVGCAAAPVARLDMPFDESQARELLKPGTNTIRGSALLRQAGGGVVTCAGQEVTLIPATEYAKKRMSMIYGSRNLSRGLNFETTPPGYMETMRTSTCNAQGFFTFEKVSNGEFFLTTIVAWKVNAYSVEGGALMGRVSVAGGEGKEIVLTQN